MNPEALVEAVVDKLKSVREEKGISQRVLSEKTKLSQGGIAHMELGDTTPTLLYLLTIADALEEDLGQIISACSRDDKKPTA